MIDVSRRSLVAAGALGVAAAGMAGGAASRAKAASARGAPLVIDRNGRYPVAPLAKPAFTLGAAQSRVIPVDLSRVKASRAENLKHMIGLIDASFGFGPTPDLIQFHEFPITGFGMGWTREETLKVAIEIPGEETEALAKKAREHQCYLVFGSYARDAAWPGHVLSITTVIGPDGSILGTDWKLRNIKGAFGGQVELFTTTVYDVLDRFVEMYGRDAVVPVLRTPIGNLAMSSAQNEPELFRAMAIKGAEVILRTASGGFNPTDIAATSLYNRVFTTVVNNAISPGSPYFEDTGAGGTAIYGPDGNAMASARSPNETLVMARIPIESFRATHRQPTMHPALYTDVMAGYVAPYPPNLYTAYQPSSLEDAARYLRDKRVWK